MIGSTIYTCFTPSKHETHIIVKKLVALLLLSYICYATVHGLWLFLRIPLVGQQCVVVVFPDHTHLLFGDTLILNLSMWLLEPCAFSAQMKTV